METTIEYRGYIGIMEKKMEATIVYRGFIGLILRRNSIFPHAGKVSLRLL